MYFLYYNLSESYLSLDFLVLYQALIFSSVLLLCISGFIALVSCFVSLIAFVTSVSLLWPYLSWCLLLWLLALPLHWPFASSIVLVYLMCSARLSLSLFFPISMYQQIFSVLVRILLIKLILLIEIPLLKVFLCAPYLFSQSSQKNFKKSKEE